MMALAGTYSTLTPDQQRRKVNEKNSEILGHRITELRNRLKETIQIKDKKGKKHRVIVSELADYPDIKAKFVQDAKKDLVSKQAIKDKFDNNKNSDLSKIWNSHIAVVDLENAIESLSDERLDKDKRWNTPASAFRFVVKSVSDPKIKKIGDVDYASFEATIVARRTKDKKTIEMSYNKWKKDYNKGKEANLEYLWITYAFLSGGEIHVVNPYLNTPGHENEQNHVGVVKRGIKAPGGRTVDAVVAEGPTGKAKRIAKGQYDILYEIPPITVGADGKPIIDLSPIQLDARAIKTVTRPAGVTCSIPVPSHKLQGVLVLEQKD
jgi:hypothetical protein